jgi:hypothetical protein
MNKKNTVPSVSNIKTEIIAKSNSQDHIYNYKNIFNNFIGKKAKEKEPSSLLQENIQYDIRDILQEEYKPRTSIIYHNEQKTKENIEKQITEKDNFIIKDNNKILHKWEIQ